MSTFLDELLDGAHRRVEAARARTPDEELVQAARSAALPPSFADALAADGVGVIAEIKRASPSKGALAPDLDAAEQAARYGAGGAAAISVLTEPDRFEGSLDDLLAASGSGLPTLRKDFVVDAYQIWEARRAGAAAVLLIVAALDDDDLRDLLAATDEAGLDALVEVHDRGELERAQAVGATIIGVNARDLRTFEVHRNAFALLRPHFPAGAIAVAESGIRGPADVAVAGAQGADAVLVGEALVTSDDPQQLLERLVAAGRQELAR
ncbi:MAG: indole-3-glycerol phosphate synthase TrpC [Nitriliruptorales bacterium]|nr:indole-3-glycerol phosphate synthase TrpC [Nitriliruptorales bacterium]